MSRELRGEIELELSLLTRELEEAQPLLSSAKKGTPSATEIRASAAVLHAFYNGVERIFELISRQLDGNLPTGADWHKELLVSVSEAKPCRPAVISESLRVLLRRYLEFRHFFRHAYSHTFRWGPMAPLTVGLPDVFEKLKAELADFLNRCVPE